LSGQKYEILSKKEKNTLVAPKRLELGAWSRLRDISYQEILKKNFVSHHVFACESINK